MTAPPSSRAAPDATCGCAHRADQHDESGHCLRVACGCTRFHELVGHVVSSDLQAAGDELAAAMWTLLAARHNGYLDMAALAWSRADRAARRWQTVRGAS